VRVTGVAASLVVVVVLAGSACLGGLTAPTISGTGKRILFIGNSHTYVNDVPGLVQAMAAAAGPEPIAVASDAPSNYALIDHANGDALKEISGGEWKVVVLQQGWTPAGACRDTLRLATKMLAAEAAKIGARVGMYQVWTPINRPNHLPGTIRSYELAAEDVNGLLFPAAAAFRVALERDPTLQLYADGLHASPRGSYLVALVMYATLFERSPIGLPATLTTLSGGTLSISPADAATLQEAAADVTVRGLGRSDGQDGPVIANPGSC
jgi:hypothetical protein